MAKMKTKTSGEVAREVRINADEIRAMIREQFPEIPEDVDMMVATDDISEELKEVTFSWTSRTSDSQETDLVPAPAKCRRHCQPPSEDVLHTLLPRPSKLGEIAEREANE
jgi:hypothetical protein